MNSSNVLKSLTVKAKKESMLPIEKLEKLVGKCTKIITKSCAMCLLMQEKIIIDENAVVAEGIELKVGHCAINLPKSDGALATKPHLFRNLLNEQYDYRGSKKWVGKTPKFDNIYSKHI